MDVTRFGGFVRDSDDLKVGHGCYCSRWDLVRNANVTEYACSGQAFGRFSQ